MVTIRNNALRALWGVLVFLAIVFAFIVVALVIIRPVAQPSPVQQPCGSVTSGTGI